MGNFIAITLGSTSAISIISLIASQGWITLQGIVLQLIEVYRSLLWNFIDLLDERWSFLIPNWNSDIYYFFFTILSVEGQTKARALHTPSVVALPLSFIWATFFLAIPYLNIIYAAVALGMGVFGMFFRSVPEGSEVLARDAVAMGPLMWMKLLGAIALLLANTVL